LIGGYKLVLKCDLCNREFQDYTSLGSHIGQSHRDIGLKGYYNKFLKVDSIEGICKNPNCKKETKFCGLIFGFNNHCSRQCSTKMLRTGKPGFIKQEKQICEFCGREFKSLTALSSHLGHPNSTCNIKFNKLKEEKQNNKKIKCEICKNKYEDYRSLGIHIVQFHGHCNKDSKKEYYDKYLKKDPNEGICKTCGRETRFILLTKGYDKHCNPSCAKLDPEVEEKSRQTCLKNHGVTNYAKTKEWSDQMKNGQARIMMSKVKFPSKPQIKLYNIVREIYPSAEIEYWEDVAGKRIDIGIKDLMIAIEYDGFYWHQDKDSDDKRQKLLENIGWKFIRYNGGPKDTVPSLEQIQNDINKLLEI
jgi:hypothetical protein